jgi:ferredoxin-nitrite reductase
MGGPARKLDEATGKMMAVPGCKIFVGGRIGEDAHLALEPLREGVPLNEEDLVPELVEILKTQFGATDKKTRKRDVLKKLVGLA